MPPINFTVPATKRKRVLDGISGKTSQPELVLLPPPLIEKVAGFVRELSKTRRPAQENSLIKFSV